VAPDSLPEPIAVAGWFAGHLDRIGVRYVIGGSFASSVHGEPRSTNDIDIVADLHEADVDRFVEGLAADYYVSRPAVADAVRSGGAFNVIHIPTAVKVDVFVSGDDPFDRERLDHRVPVRFSVGGDLVEVFVDTAEDTILRKLEWYRRGDELSERQWRDITGIVDAQASRLDRVYLFAWAARLGVTDLLERALGRPRSS
jgi:hypothetical protein